jgi:formate dehydrogenase iron-sulfur subunit
MPPDTQIPRRTFLKAAAVTAGAVGLANAMPDDAQASGGSPEELAHEHFADRSMLIDITKCVGCGKCVTACKFENDLEWREDQPAEGPDARLASENYSVVRTVGVVPGETSGTGSWQDEAPRRRGEQRYVRQQCMHCLEPACVSACFVAALTKSPEGNIVYDGDMCVGCRYCQMACPFSVPAFEWDETFGRIRKCDLCYERALRGEPTACSEACPTGAITFGHRGDLLEEAWARIDAHPGAYVRHVYGETEVGGTSVLYLSDVPFEELGFRTELPTEPLPSYTWEITRLLPPIATGLGAMLTTLWLRRRRILAKRGEHLPEREAEGVTS